MSDNWKYIAARISLGLLLTVVLAVAYFLGRNQFSNTRCKDIKVTVHDSLQTRFVTEKAVKEYLAEEYRGLVGKPLSKVDLHKVENILVNKTTIQTCNAFITADGYLNVTVTQRKPAVRFQNPGGGFYCDQQGSLIPIQPTYAADVPIIDGHIPVDTTGTPDAQWLKDIVSMTRQIEADPIWREAISQIHCNEKTDLIIVTEVGEEKFIFGQPKDVSSKLEKMQLYYEMIATDPEKKYDTVDLRFGNQIVCKNNE